MDTVLAGTVAVVVASALVTRLSYSWLLPKPIPDIPHNPITGILGDIPAFTHDKKNGNKLFSNFVVDMVKTYGPISQILFGWHRMVIVANKEEAERLTSAGKIVDTTERFRTAHVVTLFSVRYYFADSTGLEWPFIMANTGILRTFLFIQDETWKKHRRLAGPSMSKRYLERMSERIAFGANQLVRLWEAKYALVGSAAFEADLDFHFATMVRPDSPSNTYPMLKISIWSVGQYWHRVNITFGDSIGCVESAYRALPSTYPLSTTIAHFPPSDPPPVYTAGKVIAKAIEKALQSPFPKLTTWIFTYTSPTWWKNYNFMVSFFTSAIVRARKREAELERAGKGLSTDADCVLDMIVQRERREGVETLGDRDILDELITYVFAGQDTTASTLSWLVKYLPDDPEIQQRLHEEMCNVFGADADADADSNKGLNFDLLDDPERVPILEAVVAETMRCAAVAAFVGRELLKDEIILNRVVPKGTDIFFATDIMGKDTSVWGPDAEEWRPTRWLTQDGLFNRSAGPSIPFGMGQRSCFGQRLAIHQLKMYLAIMSRRFFFKRVPPEVGTWEAVEVIGRRPMMCYVSLENWESKINMEGGVLG
ncbi:Cytochrome P450 4V2 [Rhizoctonia solani]|uniref:Cytochrome P450 4V2 n=1 Tax=Rhizoctonia solani TaxID=456999 RepID=A0A0K6FJZ5_9AGAM|nr:Cytochrome P450 4V2 [Rhizoctonia solani]